MDASIFDLLIAGSGLYLIYTAITMKKHGQVKSGVIVSKDVDVDKIRDKQGFINYMYAKVLLIGILAVVAGSISLLNTKLHGPDIVSVISMIGYLVVLAAFAVATVKARKKFID